MARLLRLEFPGACYHVINRGNYRKAIFAPKGAAGAFETCLFEACGRFGWRLHAFVIMDNHFHLALDVNEQIKLTHSPMMGSAFGVCG